MSAEQKIASVLDVFGDVAIKVGPLLGGEAAIVLEGVGGIAKAGAFALKVRGDSLDQLLSKITTPRTVKFDWENASESETVPATPSAIAAAKKDST